MITACYEIREFHHGRYVPSYYKKETVVNTWNQTLEGYLVIGSFIEDPRKMQCAYLVQIQKSANVLGDERRK